MRAEADARLSPVRTFAIALGAALLLGSPVRVAAAQQEQAQPAAEKVLAIDDYERWRSITNPTISDTGAWVTYGYRRPNAHDPHVVLYIKSLRDDAEFEVLDASEPHFSDDSRWVAYFVDLPYEEAEKLRDQGEPRRAKCSYWTSLRGSASHGTTRRRSSFRLERPFSSSGRPGPIPMPSTMAPTLFFVRWRAAPNS